MAEPYDVLASLNRMLESEERREEMKLQSSLALMQFAQQKRMQDIQLAGQRLELLQASNAQMIGNQAEAFLEESGLMYLYQQTYHKDEAKYIKNFATRLGKKKYGYGFTPETSERIASAVVASQAGNHKPILDIANQIGVHIDNMDAGLAGESTQLQKELFDVFQLSPNATYTEDRINQMQQTQKNQALILKEMIDFGHGDYDISPEITFDEIYAASDDELQESLFNLSNEKSGQLQQEDVKSLITNSTLSEDSDSISKQMSLLSAEIAGQREDMQNIDTQISMINSKKSSGVKLSKEEEEFFNRADEMKSLAETQITNLSSQIDDLKEDKVKAEAAKSKFSMDRVYPSSWHQSKAIGALGNLMLGANRAALPEHRK
tara:strand:+ start:4783 stop:5913 length:1131 start_codon:yes stop_codon:yes gene_type:complete